MTDSAGRFTRWGISPYESVSIAIDSASLRYPWWVPLAPSLELQMEAGRFRQVFLPVVSGATLEGRVRWEGSQGSPAGLTLRLRNLQTGAIRPLSLFSDGSFYEVGIPPGDYEVTGTLMGASGASESAAARLTVPAQSASERESTEPLLLTGLSIVLRPESKPTVAAQPDH